MAPDTYPRDPNLDDDQRAARYEAWKARLEKTLGDYHRRMPIYRRCFQALTLAGFACFVFGVRLGVWGAFSATLVSIGGWAMLKARFWELETEIGQMRDEIARLKR